MMPTTSGSETRKREFRDFVRPLSATLALQAGVSEFIVRIPVRKALHHGMLIQVGVTRNRRSGAGSNCLHCLRHHQDIPGLPGGEYDRPIAHACL